MADDPSDALVAALYDELHRLAHHYMRGERAGHTLQTTALVNEAYLRLAGLDRMQWRDRTHFVAMAATTMRRVLVDHIGSRDRHLHDRRADWRGRYERGVSGARREARSSGRIEAAVARSRDQSRTAPSLSRRGARRVIAEPSAHRRDP